MLFIFVDQLLSMMPREFFLFLMHIKPQKLPQNFVQILSISGKTA